MVILSVSLTDYNPLAGDGGRDLLDAITKSINLAKEGNIVQILIRASNNMVHEKKKIEKEMNEIFHSLSITLRVNYAIIGKLLMRVTITKQEEILTSAHGG